MTLRALMPALGSNPSTAEIDRYVHEVIDLHFAGHIDEPTTRKEISGALYAANIHSDVADRYTDLSAQARRDLGESLLKVVTDKMINGTFYSLEAGRTRSACGWARQVAKSAVQSELRNSRRAANRNGNPIDPTSHEFTATAHTVSRLVVLDAHTVHTDAAVSELIDEFTDRTRGMRDTDRIVACAETLCVALGVEPALRPELMADRDFCLKALNRDPNLALRSLRAWSSLVHGSDADAVGNVDGRLLALWDEQTEDSTAELISRGPRVAHMLAIAAVSPLPRPPKKALQKLKTVVMAGNGIYDRKWRELASSLVDSYIASEFEAVSQYATMTDETRKAARTGHAIARRRLDTLLERAAKHPGAPFGNTSKRVLARIVDGADVVLNPSSVDERPKETPRRSSARVA